MTFPTKYRTDGVTSEWSFDWPFLDRSHVFVTVNDAARSFSFIDDGTIRCVDSLGNPFAAGLPLVINRATPDLVDLARFKDAANLTAADLNRARLQLLFLIQERSGGIAGAVGTVISNLTNEIETISGALDSIAETQGVLHAGLGQMKGLTDRVTVVENGAQALLDQIQQEIDNRVAGDSALASRVDSMSLKVGNLSASVQSDINLLQSNDAILASQTSKIQAQIDALDKADGQTDDDILSASLITSAIASVKKDAALVQSITTLEATLKETIDGRLTQVEAMVQTEQTARADADKALAQQITTLQSKINDNIAQVVQDMHTSVDAVNGKVTGLQAQYTLKAQVKRDDGTVVMGGIGLAATANDDYVGSKLVLMADSILFADPNTPNGELVTFLEAGLVDGQATLVVPSTRVGDKTIPGRVLVDGSIEARSIKANSITGDKLVAGTIDTDRLAVGLGANILKNSTFVQGLVEWGYAWTTGVAGTSSATETAGVNYSSSWRGPGLNVAWLHSSSRTGVTDINKGYSQLNTTQVPVLASTYYEFSAYVGNYGGATIDIGLNFYDASGAYISSAGYIGAGSQFASTVSIPSGQTISSYQRIGGIGKSPVNAATALIIIRKSFPAGSDNFAFITQPMLAQTSASATRLSPYTPSGLGTLITPAGISTPSLSALSATIGTLRTATSGARMEIEDNQLRVYDANNVLRLRLGVWG